MSLDRRRAHLAAVLAGVGGFVDAVGFLVLFEVFVAHMSGNTAALGAELGSREAVGHVAERLAVIPVFAVGVGAGHLVGARVKRRSPPSELASLLLIEAFLLAGFVVSGVMFEDGSGWAENSWRAVVVAALGAAAMGVQSAALRRVGDVTVHTAFITGVVTNIAVDVARLIEARSGSNPGDGTERAAAARGLSVRVPVFFAFFLGAVLGGLLAVRWGMGAAVIPLAVISGLVVVLRWRRLGTTATRPS